MASAFSHAIAAAALGSAFRTSPMPARFWVLGMTCAVIPDADVIAFAFGIPYEHVLGHRGLSHSLLFAAVLATAVVVTAFRSAEWSMLRGRLWWYFLLATVSHGVLDAMTTGGLGVAFFAPFHDARYFFPFRPILVSPIGVGRFFSQRGLAVIGSEMVWIWGPALVLAVVASIRRRRV
jgi:inner membrane protein